MITPEALGRVGDLTLVRWRDPALPPGLTALIAEAEAAGIGWIADFAPEWRRRPFLDAGEALFLAFDGERPVAMAVLSLDPHTADRETGRLRYIFVGAAARGRGLLRRFVDLCLARGRGRWRRLRLHTDNLTAARVYEGYGFAATATELRSTHVLEDYEACATGAPPA